MKLAILTSYNSELKAMARWADYPKSRYCQKYGYVYILEKESGLAHPVWDKFWYCQKYLSNFDWIFWLDADATVANESIKLESLIDPKFDFIVAHGVHQICTGAFFIKNCDWSFAFLDKLWSMMPENNRYLGEQQCFNTLALNPHIKIVEQRKFNSFDVNYQDGDFIRHLAGLRNSDRERIFRKMCFDNIKFQ